MGFLRTTFAVSGWSSFGAAAAFVFWTRRSRTVDNPPNDYIFNHTLFARYNPNNTPVMQDRCDRKVPLKDLRPELLETEGRLVEAFCAGVFSGRGYGIQRAVLERIYRDADTADQLWDVRDLQSSAYPVGTLVTDHFEVMAKSPTSIIVRAGDTPRRKDVRALDGLLEFIAEVNQDEGVAEFGIKTVFWNGLAVPDSRGNPPGPPFGRFVQWLHTLYAKALMETAVANCSNK